MRIELLLLALVLTPGGTVLGQRAEATQAAKPTISISISPLQEAVKSGSPIVVKLVLTNISDHKLGFSWIRGSGGRNFEVNVSDSQGHPAQPAPRKGIDKNGRHWVRMSAGSAYVVYLEPGQAKTDEFDASDFYVLTRPDKYTIQLQRADGESKTVVESNTVSVTVTP